jgi:hypothetical protein
MNGFAYVKNVVLFGKKGSNTAQYINCGEYLIQVAVFSIFLYSYSTDNFIFRGNTMDALIKISSTEFNEDLFKKIKSLLKSFGTAEVTIAVSNKGEGILRKESDAAYLTRLDKASKDIDDGKGIIFSMDELDEYINKKAVK